MERTCPQCSKVFHPQRSDAVYCSTTCRARAHRGIAVVEPRDTQSDITPSGQPGLVDALTQELSNAGVLESSEAQAALILARRVQAANETGSALAALSKQMVALKGEALASVSKRDQMDEVTRRRDAKLRAAGRA